MKVGRFEEAWTKCFGQLAPLGFVLREAFSDRWVRFHALPESKRSAETDAEAQVILERGYCLRSEMFAVGTPVWIFLMGPTGDVGRHRITERFDRIVETNWNEADWFGTFGAMAAKWSSGAFDRLLGDVASDRMYAVFFDPGTGRVFAPYDGGFDLFWESEAQAQAAHDRHPDWLSGHPSGL